MRGGRGYQCSTGQSLPLEGKPLLCSVSPYVDFCNSNAVTERAGHAAAPTNEIGGASRPSSVMAYAMTLRNGMTATGSHEYFYSLRGAQPPGEGIPQKNQAPAFRGKAILR